MAQSTTFLNGADVVQKLETYVEQGRLRPSTVFATFDVSDLYTVLPHEGTIDARSFFDRVHQRSQITGHVH